MTLSLTDSGLETDLIFHHGVDLPAFAAFPLLDDPAGLDRMGHAMMRAAKPDAADEIAEGLIELAGR